MDWTIGPPRPAGCGLRNAGERTVARSCVLHGKRVEDLVAPPHPWTPDTRLESSNLASRLVEVDTWFVTYVVVYPAFDPIYMGI